MPRHAVTIAARILIALPVATAAAAAQEGAKAATICLAPTSAKMVSGNTEAAIAAVRETFTSFLTGPSIGVMPLEARLASQAREEAAQKGCRFVLVTTMKHERKTDRGLLRRAASGAVEAGAWQVLGSSSSKGARVAAGAVGTAAVAARDLAHGVRSKDVLELGWRLESGTGAVILEVTEKREAKSDGQDLLTPLVEKASETIVEIVAVPGK